MGNMGLLREIVDALPFAALVSDPSGSVIWWSKTAEQIFGWKRSEVLGRFNPIIPPDRRDEFRAFLEIASGGRVMRVNSVRQRKDGAQIEVKITMAPMRSGSGPLKNVLTLNEPIGEPAGRIREHHDELSLAALSRFTPRQREIITLVVRGCSNREIAKNLSLGEQQIKNYLRGIYRETQVANRTDLVVWLNKQPQRDE